MRRSSGARTLIAKSSVIFLLLALIGLGVTLIRNPAQIKAAAPASKTNVELDLKALAEPLQDLTPADQDIVHAAVELIEKKQHTLALAKLSALTSSNPTNSALRVLRAYVLLELGNKAGALDDARAAESSGLRAAYRCWFLAQVAYATGNTPLCRREIEHLAGNPAYRSRIDNLRQDLDAPRK